MFWREIPKPFISKNESFAQRIVHDAKNFHENLE